MRMWKKWFWMLAAAVLLAVGAKQDVQAGDYYGACQLIVSLDETGNIDEDGGAVPAVICRDQNNNVIVFSDTLYEEMTDAAGIALYISDSGECCSLTLADGYEEYLGNYNVILWTADVGENVEKVPPLASGYEYGDSGTLSYWSTAGERLTQEIILDGVEDGSYSWSCPNEEFSFDVIWYPALFLNSEGEAVLTVTKAGNIGLCEMSDGDGTASPTQEPDTEETTQETTSYEDTRSFSEIGKGSSHWDERAKSSFLKGNLISLLVLAAAVILAVVGLILLLLKIKKRKISHPREPQIVSRNPNPTVGYMQERNQEYSGGGALVAPRYYIEGLSGPMAGKRYPVSENWMTLGRDPGSQVVFPANASGVSRNHCRIRFPGNGVQLEDAGSTYGTFLKGRGKLIPGQPALLKEGDVFWLGAEENSFLVRQAG